MRLRRLGRTKTMKVDQDGAERVVELVTLLAVASEVVTGLIQQLRTATADQIAALANDAKTSVERIVSCCANTASLDHLPSESAQTMRGDIVRLGEALQAEIAGIIKLRWAQLESGGSSQTRH
jgi:hypothetical protein